MTYGLTLHELEIILEILQKYPQIEKAILFGSRAMRKEKKGSDVDIALKGSKLTETIFEVSRELNEESPLPYYFDIIDYDSIESTDLKSHIDRVGREIYERKI